MSNTMPFFPLIPPGTRVVTRGDVQADGIWLPAGAEGTILRAPADATHSYLVLLADGREVVVRRSKLSIRQKEPAPAPEGDGLDEGALRRYVIYRCVVGSQAYGLAEPGSDVDRRGVYLPPATLHWSLRGVPEQLEDRTNEEVYWELQKFLVMALRANPNVLECLYSPMVEFVASPADELLAIRHIFLSKLVYGTYHGYVLSQFKRLEQGLRVRGEIRWKHVMHLIRLLLAGIALLREGLVQLDVGPERERLLAIRAGAMPWPEVEAWRLALHRAFECAYEATHLPDRPDYARADAFLIAARRRMAQ